MRTAIRKQLEIFRAVILLVFNRTKRVIYAFVVDNFNSCKIPPKHLFHNQMGTQDVSICVNRGMFVRKDTDIAALCGCAAFPVGNAHILFGLIGSLFAFSCKTYVSFPLNRKRRLLSAFHRITYFLLSFFRRFASEIDCVTFLKFSFSFRHNSLQFKKAVFGLLTKERLDSFTLLTALNISGNPVQSLAFTSIYPLVKQCK